MTTSDDLVKSPRRARLRLLKPPPSPRPGVALVVHRPGHDPIAILPNDRMTMGEVAWGRNALFYEVDIAERSLEFVCKLPCKGDASEFSATAHVTYRVSDPVIIVGNDEISDGQELVRQLTLDLMRTKSREFEVEQSAEAEAAISELVLATDHEPPSGLRIVRFAVELRLEDEAREFMRSLKSLERSKKYELGESELEKQRLELAQQLKRMKLDFYGPLVRRGEWELLVLYLAENPDDVSAVAAKLRELDDRTFDRQFAMLKALRDGDDIEGFHVEEAAQRLLGKVLESLESGTARQPLEGMPSPEALEAESNAPDDLGEEECE